MFSPLKPSKGRNADWKILFACTWQDASKWQQLPAWQRGCPYLTSTACSAIYLKTEQQQQQQEAQITSFSDIAGITAQDWLEEPCSVPHVERSKESEQWAGKGEMWVLGNVEFHVLQEIPSLFWFLFVFNHQMKLLSFDRARRKVMYNSCSDSSAHPNSVV